MKRITLILLAFNIIIINAQTANNRSTLSGNWNGLRDSLKSNGISIKPRISVFQQNYLSGVGNNDNDFNGKFDLDIKLNGKKIGLKRTTIGVHLEQNFGNAFSKDITGFNKGGALLPINTAAAFPGSSGQDRFDISSLYIMQQFGKANSLMLGKINVLDLTYNSRFNGGGGIYKSWNVGTAAPISGITPAYIFGAIAKIKTKPLNYTFMIYDPSSVVNKSGLEKPFNEGVTLSAKADKEIRLGKYKGTHSLRVAFSTRDGYDLGEIALPSEEATNKDVVKKKSRWFAYYKVNQPLVMYDDKRGFGLYGQISVSDGNPNSFDHSWLVGLGGHSFIKNRTNDLWGINVFNYSLSSHIDNLFEDSDFKLNNSQFGFEMFYDLHLNNYWSLGTDLQIIDPILKNYETAVYLGFRTSIKL